MTDEDARRIARADGARARRRTYVIIAVTAVLAGGSRARRRTEDSKNGCMGCFVFGR